MEKEGKDKDSKKKDENQLAKNVKDRCAACRTTPDVLLMLL